MNRPFFRDDRASVGGVTDLTDQEKTVCSVCSSSAESIFRVACLDEDFRDLPMEENPFSEIRIQGCKNCGFGWAFPYIDSAQLDRFYTKIYRKARFQHGSHKPSYQEFAPLEPRSVSQILLARMFKSFRQGQAVLEIGPGQGRSFRAISQLIPGLKCFAFEPDANCGTFLQKFMGVHVFPYKFPVEPTAGTIVEGRKFDLVLMSHVLEHFNGKDVIAVLQNVRSIVSEDGILICEVPQCDWRQHEKLARGDPSHLSCFSHDSFGLALLRAGFNVKFLNTCSDEYGLWQNKVGSSILPRAVPQHAPLLVAWIRQIYRLIPISLPRWIGASLYALMFPDQIAHLLRSDDFNYGGERTCLRAAAVIA